MKNILIFGAGGYVGIPLCENLINKGYKVIAVDRFFFGIDKLKKVQNENLKIVKDDIRFFDEKILEGIDVVIDLCGLSNDASSEIDINLTKDINYLGSKRLADLSKKFNVKHFLYSSSASVYGYNNKKFLSETDELNPITEYAKSKVKLEKHLLSICNENFNVTILRNSTIYGYSNRMRFDLAVNIMTMTGTKDKIIYVMGDGNQYRPFINVNDVVKAFRMCIENPSLVKNEILNVGSNDQNFSIKELSKHIQEIINDAKIIHIPNNPDNRSYSLNFEKIKNLLGFGCDYDIRSSVVELREKIKIGLVDTEDETTHTLKWYKKLMEFDEILTNIKINNKLLS